MTNADRAAQWRNRLSRFLLERQRTWNKVVAAKTDEYGMLRVYAKDYKELGDLFLEMIRDLEVSQEPTLVDRYATAVNHMMGMV